MRSGVIKSQIKSHQAIHDGMFSFIQLCILPHTPEFNSNENMSNGKITGMHKFLLSAPINPRSRVQEYFVSEIERFEHFVPNVWFRHYICDIFP
jgi:hypothetical protein